MLAENTVLQGRYKIIRTVGQGGMGAVYMARDLRLNNVVALKENFFNDEKMMRAFQHEAQLLAGLRHSWRHRHVLDRRPADLALRRPSCCA